MRKRDELFYSKSCLSRAHPEEFIFVLLSRDAAAPAAIRAWCAERIRLGKNTDNDPQITEALECARMMEAEARCWVTELSVTPDEEERMMEAEARCWVTPDEEERT